MLFLITLGLSLAAMEAGYGLGKYRRRVAETEKEATVAPILAATLGLLAFMLAFTFGLAASRFDARRQMVIEEANSIGTTYLRAGLLPEPYRSEVRDLLRQYVNVRVEGVQSGDVEGAMAASVKLHDQLWPHAEALAKADPHSIAAGIFIESLNDTIDLHAKRVLVGVRNRIPIVVWGALYLIACLSMAELGYSIGLAGSRRSIAVAILILTFSVVMLLIEDLDRPREGLLRVSQEAMLDLQKSLGSQADQVPPPQQ
jgi:hypothetical protein